MGKDDVFSSYKCKRKCDNICRPVNGCEGMMETIMTKPEFSGTRGNGSRGHFLVNLAKTCKFVTINISLIKGEKNMRVIDGIITLFNAIPDGFRPMKIETYYIKPETNPPFVTTQLINKIELFVNGDIKITIFSETFPSTLLEFGLTSYTYLTCEKIVEDEDHIFDNCKCKRKCDCVCRPISLCERITKTITIRPSTNTTPNESFMVTLTKMCGFVMIDIDLIEGISRFDRNIALYNAIPEGFRPKKIETYYVNSKSDLLDVLPLNIELSTSGDIRMITYPPIVSLVLKKLDRFSYIYIANYNHKCSNKCDCVCYPMDKCKKMKKSCFPVSLQEMSKTITIRPAINNISPQESFLMTFTKMCKFVLISIDLIADNPTLYGDLIAYDAIPIGFKPEKTERYYVNFTPVKDELDIYGVIELNKNGDIRIIITNNQVTVTFPTTLLKFVTTSYTYIAYDQ